MKIDLPAENWLDIFAFIPRQQLANQVSLVDKTFWKNAHCWLHEGGKLSLGGNLHFDSTKVSGSSGLLPERKAVLWSGRRKMFFPEVPMPDNIVRFEQLVISHVDSQVLDALTKMRSLLIDLHIWLDFESQAEQSVALWMLGQIGHLLESVDSLHLPAADTIGKLNAQFPSILNNLKLLYFEEFLSIESSLMDTLCSWLHSSEHVSNKGTRKLICVLTQNNAFVLVERIKEIFIASSHPATFFIRLKPYGYQSMEDYAEFKIANKNTNELLCLEKVGTLLLLNRHFVDATQQLLRKEMEELLAWNFEKQTKRVILRVDLDEA